MKYAWIARHRAQWPVTLAWKVLGVSVSGYFAHWRRKDAYKPSRPGANKRITGEALLVHIKAIHAVANALNTRPRKTLDWRTPAEALNEYLKSSQRPSVATTG